jgi:hypothetical protein
MVGRQGGIVKLNVLWKVMRIGLSIVLGWKLMVITSHKRFKCNPLPNEIS